jgi:hypothetical protein
MLTGDSTRLAAVAGRAAIAVSALGALPRAQPRGAGRAAPQPDHHRDLSEDIYPQLSHIAPTVAVQRPSNAAWKEPFELTVRAAGLEREGAEVTQRYAEVVERVRSISPPGMPSGEWALRHPYRCGMDSGPLVR